MSIPKTDDVSPSQFNINDILQYTEPKQPGIFRKILSSVAGGAANVFAPGIGTIIGNAIGGGITLPFGGGLTGGEPLQLLQIQQQLQAEQRQFEFASNYLKLRHDTEMDAIRNLK